MATTTPTLRLSVVKTLEDTKTFAIFNEGATFYGGQVTYESMTKDSNAETHEKCIPVEKEHYHFEYYCDAEYHYKRELVMAVRIAKCCILGFGEAGVALDLGFRMAAVICNSKLNWRKEFAPKSGVLPSHLSKEEYLLLKMFSGTEAIIVEGVGDFAVYIK